MSVKLKSKGRAMSNSEVIISKIILHSKVESSPKFLKYIQHARKTFSSSCLKIWMDLRTKGGLQAIEYVVRNLVHVQFPLGTSGPVESKSCRNSTSDTHGLQSRDQQNSVLNVQKEVLITGLSVLANAYSLDYVARKDVSTNGFIDVLHRLIQKSLTPTNSNSAELTYILSTSITATNDPTYEAGRIEITTKAVKCIGNLAHDSSCRDIILKSGVGISILKILEGFNQLWTLENARDKEKAAKDLGVELAETRNWNDEKECIRACIRAVRILSSKPFCSEDAKNHLIRFRAVITIGKVLSWCSDAFPQDDFTLEIIRALISLTDRIRLLPSDQIEELVCEEMGNTTLKKLVDVFNNCPHEGKLFSPTIRSLTHLSYNTLIAESLGRLQIFKIALEKLKQTSRTASSEICGLLLTLTKHSSVNQCVLNNCQEIWSTLTILKTSDCQEYHRWVLHVYENVYEGSLKSLLKNGLIELVHHHLKEELEDCDYEMLKRKIMSLEDDSCRVHATSGCQFVPTYRCDSPSYQQVQEEVKVRLQDRESLNKMEIDSSGVESSSPSSSPARSWTSEDSIPSISSDPGCSRAVSPTSASDDEGCYSPVYSFSSSPSYSQTSPERDIGMSDDETPLRDSFSSPQFKRPRLETDGANALPELSFRPFPKSSEHLKAKSKKIVSILNILQKCTHLSPVPQNLVRVIPMLLSFIVRGIVSLTPDGPKQDQMERDSETVNLGRQSFSLAYRILKTMCLNINMFPEFVRSSTISIVFRLLIWDKYLEGLGSIQSVRNLLGTLSGISNDTAGWREGYLLRTLLISKCEDELDRISLAIPLIFRKNDHVLRSFETKGRSWSRVFELLKKTDENFSKFQDSILALSSLCETLGMRWTDADNVRNRPLLLKETTTMDLNSVINIIEAGQEWPVMEVEGNSADKKVELVLDDKSRVIILKDILTDASPVFSAMFDGHFMEAGEQKVRIRDMSKDAIKALAEQIILQNLHDSNQDPSPNRQSLVTEIDSNQYELSTLFELTSLSDQFLLESIYERTLNSLLCFYVCPYSAPIIYMEAVKLAALWKPQSRLRGWQLDLTYLIIKYLLVGDMSMSTRCGAFRKIFDSVSPEIIVGDMRALVEYYCTRPQAGR